MQKFYSEDDAEQILRKAIQHSDPVTGSAGISRDRLQQMAAEAGITVEALEQAEQAHIQERETTRARAEFRQRKIGKFYTHISSYVFTNLCMVGIWWFSGGGYFWPMWLLLFWTFRLIQDFASTFVRSGASFREEQEKYVREQKTLGQHSANAESFLDDYFAVSDRGEKLMAIKAVREQFGYGLKEAKDIVDRYYLTHPA